ncbi:MAG: ATP synthase F1 subunit gamma [Patescibacteria group bacterium]|jgi:F-type H+-transporting ATPase subunit gamma
MNLRQLKSKIKSVGNVGKITKAMQLVSAVKMKKAQLRASQGKPYRDALDETIYQIGGKNVAFEHPFMKENGKATRKLAIVISSNKGLCGVFNFNLFKFLLVQIPDFARYDFVVMGSKAQQFLFHVGGSIIADFSSQMPFEANTTAVFSLVRDKFLGGSYSSIELFYNQFVSSLSCKPTKKMLLPIHFEEEESRITNHGSKMKDETQGIKKEYIVEPDQKTVLEGLFNFYLESDIRGAIHESEASEHSARMIAMKNATDNSTDLVSRLTLLRNGLRQEKITNELLDMNTAKLAVAA